MGFLPVDLRECFEVVRVERRGCTSIDVWLDKRYVKSEEDASNNKSVMASPPIVVSKTI